MMRVYAKLYGLLYRVTSFLTHVAAVLLFVMFLTVTAQVILRYVFRSPIPWAEELAVYLMFIMTYLCLPYLVISESNIAMTLIYERFKGSKWKYIFDMFFCVLILFVAYVWLPEAIRVFQENKHVASYQLPITRGDVYIIMPIALVVTLCVVFVKFFKALLCLVKPTTIALFAEIEAKLDHDKLDASN